MSGRGPGRGRLGFLDPLLGAYVAEGDSGRGPYRCERRVAPELGGAYVRIDARWLVGGGAYEELCLVGVDAEGAARAWSFTSDGKQSVGLRVDAPDLPPGAIVFESDVPAGRARQAYWPGAGDVAFHWAVESRATTGWRRFVEHAYRPLAPG